jgi:hypothetical protein
MSKYVIKTCSSALKEHVELIVKKTKGLMTFEIKSDHKNLIIKESILNNFSEFRLLVSYLNIPEDFFSYIDSDNEQEVVLFESGEIFKTTWKIEDLESFDKHLYDDHSYTVIKLLSDNYLTYKFRQKDGISTLEIKIKMKPDLLDSLDMSLITFDYLEKISGIDKLLLTLKNHYTSKNYTIISRKEKNSLILILQSNIDTI